MTYAGYLSLGDQEIINSRRAVAHMLNGIASRGVDVVHDDSWRYTHEWLGDDDYRTPETTGAPWVDDSADESYEFGGVWGLSIQGLDATEIEQDIIDSVGDGGSAGYRRLPTRVVNCEVLLTAMSSRGLQWGLRWLTRSLLKDGCNSGDQPRDLTFLESSPEYVQKNNSFQNQQLGASLTRQLTEVVVTKLPEVTEAFGTSIVRGDNSPCMAKVEFELTALVPLVWRSPVQLLGRQSLSDGEHITTRFTEVADDGSCPAVCDDDDDVLIDPSRGDLWRLPRPAAPGASIGCQLLESRRKLFTVSEGVMPATGEMRPTVVIKSGARDERHIRIRWARGLVTDDGRALDCATVGEAMVTYLPADSVLELDGRSGRARVATPDGRNLDATPVMVGRAGGPWRAPVMHCGAPYTLVVDADVDTDATIEGVIGVTGEV